MFNHSGCAKYMNWTKSLMNRVIRLYVYNHITASTIPKHMGRDEVAEINKPLKFVDGEWLSVKQLTGNR
jgi:hypothetical protein